MTPRSNSSPRMAEHIVSSGVFEDDPFFLVDIGASGGIDGRWEVFGRSFGAVGFEPLVAECESLNAEAMPGVSYVPCFVGAGAGFDALTVSNRAPIADPFPRSSAVRASAQKQADYVKEQFNRGEEVVYADRKTTLDDYVHEAGIASVDFVKVDTDGHDYEVLYGARATLAKARVLGLYVECQLHGALGEHSNTLRNIDRLLCEAGFSMFDIEVYRYTRGAMPGKFCYDIDAQTTTGQVLWGDALYLRDFASPGYADEIGVALTPTEIVKLACLQEMFGMPDCAAELLQAHRGATSELIDTTRCLDLLAQDLGIASTYEAHDRQFVSDLPSFYS